MILLPFRLNGTSSSSLYSSETCSNILITFAVPHWTHSSMFTLLFYEGKITSLHLMLCLMHPRKLFAFFAARVFCWLLFNFVSTRSSRSMKPCLIFFCNSWEKEVILYRSNEATGVILQDYQKHSTEKRGNSKKHFSLLNIYFQLAEISNTALLIFIYSCTKLMSNICNCEFADFNIFFPCWTMQ